MSAGHRLLLWKNLYMDAPEDVRSALRAAEAQFLGSGTFGETWQVRDPLGRNGQFALKLLRPEHFDHRLLQREVESLDQFDHPGIVKLHDVGTVELKGEKRYALMCEYIAGGSVGQVLRAGRQPSPQDVEAFALSLLRAVSELHSKEKIHRDIKPDNIMLRDGCWSTPVLIDFGLSRSVSGGTMTVYPAKVGSLPWMSPEQLQGKKARKAADLWACGVILYELLAGRHPFFGSLNLRDLDEDEIFDLVSVAPAGLHANVPTPLAVVVQRLVNPEAAGLRGSAQRAVRELEGER